MKRTWFITGVNGGFGRHMTEQLLAQGDRIAGTVRDLDSMADLKARHGDALWLAKLDLTDRPAIRRVVDVSFGELEHVDVVVSNAGYGLFGAAEEMTDEQITHQIDTNLLGSIQTVRAVDGLSSCPRWADRRCFRVDRCTTRANGVSRDSLTHSRRRWPCSTRSEER